MLGDPHGSEGSQTGVTLMLEKSPEQGLVLPAWRSVRTTAHRPDPFGDRHHASTPNFRAAAERLSRIVAPLDGAPEAVAALEEIATAHAVAGS